MFLYIGGVYADVYPSVRLECETDSDRNYESRGKCTTDTYRRGGDFERDKKQTRTSRGL